MDDRKVFHNSVVPIPVETGLTANGLMVHNATPAHRDETMTVNFHLDMSPDARKELENAVADGATVARNRLTRDFSAKPADAEALAAWLREHGFEVEPSAEGMDSSTVRAKATVATIEDVLQVDMVRVARNGLTFTAARNAPSLPMDVGQFVNHIGGLQPFLEAHKHAKWRLPKNGNRTKTNAAGDAARAGDRANSPPYLVPEILRAYDAAGLPVDGTGQVIAILIDTVPDDNDLRAFWQQNGMPVTVNRIQRINVKGEQLPPPSGEETLDVQWSSGIAAGATIRVYASGSLNFADLDRALDHIIADAATIPGLNQVSISLGLGETYFNGPDGEVQVEHDKFLKLAAAGVNVFVSTGDAASNPNETGHSATGPLQVEYESSDPYVVAVGGTTLILDEAGAVASETAWSLGGGGKSIYFDRPDWQTAPSITGSQRLVPDVSLTADPEQGGLVVLQGQSLQYGGTSWSAPVWAAFCALINHSRAQANKPPLSFLNPLIYPLRDTCFRDITNGSNGAYRAVAGYDLVSGLGVPRIDRLIAALS